jgi:hypothetical protein
MIVSGLRLGRRWPWFVLIASRELAADRAVVVRVRVKEMCGRRGSVINVETESYRKELMKE